MAPALAHQRTVRVRQVDLRLRLRRFRRRLDVPTLARSRTPLPRRHLALVLRPLRVRTRLRTPFQLRARTVQLRPQLVPPRQLLRQTLRVRRVVRVDVLRVIQQPLDRASQLLAQRPRPVVAEAVVSTPTLRGRTRRSESVSTGCTSVGPATGPPPPRASNCAAIRCASCSTAGGQSATSDAWPLNASLMRAHSSGQCA